MGSINLIARDNGFGLSRDLRLLAIALAARGHEVTLSPRRRGKLRKIFGPWKPRLRVVARRLRGLDTHEFDANLMLEHVRPEWFALGRHNIMMPNPDWFLPSDAQALAGIDCIFAKTRQTQAMFAGREQKIENTKLARAPTQAFASMLLAYSPFTPHAPRRPGTQAER